MLNTGKHHSSLCFHSNFCLHMGHRPFEDSCWIHVKRQCIWKEWPHFPSNREQSSPGNLQVGQVPSNCTRQMPQTSSSGMSQRQVATAFHSLMVTFMLVDRGVVGLWRTKEKRNSRRSYLSRTSVSAWADINLLFRPCSETAPSLRDHYTFLPLALHLFVIRRGGM